MFSVVQGCTWVDEHSGPFSWKTKVRTVVYIHVWFVKLFERKTDSFLIHIFALMLSACNTCSVNICSNVFFIFPHSFVKFM